MNENVIDHILQFLNRGELQAILSVIWMGAARRRLMLMDLSRFSPSKFYRTYLCDDDNDDFRIQWLSKSMNHTCSWSWMLDRLCADVVLRRDQSVERFLVSETHFRNDSDMTRIASIIVGREPCSIPFRFFLVSVIDSRTDHVHSMSTTIRFLVSSLLAIEFGKVESALPTASRDIIYALNCDQTYNYVISDIICSMAIKSESAFLIGLVKDDMGYTVSLLEEFLRRGLRPDVYFDPLDVNDLQTIYEDEFGCCNANNKIAGLKAYFLEQKIRGRISQQRYEEYHEMLSKMMQ